MGVSKNKGTPKWMVYNGKTLLKWMIWGDHYFWKPPTSVSCSWLVVFHFPDDQPSSEWRKKHRPKTYLSTQWAMAGKWWIFYFDQQKPILVTPI